MTQFSSYLLSAAHAELPAMQIALTQLHNGGTWILPSDMASWFKFKPSDKALSSGDIDMDDADADDADGEADFAARKAKNKGKGKEKAVDARKVDTKKSIFEKSGATAARLDKLSKEMLVEIKSSRDFTTDRSNSDPWRRVLCISRWKAPSSKSFSREANLWAVSIIIWERCLDYRRKMGDEPGAGTVRYDIVQTLLPFAVLVGANKKKKQHQWGFIDGIVPKDRPEVDVARSLKARKRHEIAAKRERVLQRILNDIQGADFARASDGTMKGDVNAVLHQMMAVLGAHAAALPEDDADAIPVTFELKYLNPLPSAPLPVKIDKEQQTDATDPQGSKPDTTKTPAAPPSTSSDDSSSEDSSSGDSSSGDSSSSDEKVPGEPLPNVSTSFRIIPQCTARADQTSPICARTRADRYSATCAHAQISERQPARTRRSVNANLRARADQCTATCARTRADRYSATCAGHYYFRLRLVVSFFGTSS
jgi:hypothetical protein